MAAGDAALNVAGDAGPLLLPKDRRRARPCIDDGRRRLALMSSSGEDQSAKNEAKRANRGSSFDVLTSRSSLGIFNPTQACRILRQEFEASQKT